MDPIPQGGIKVLCLYEYIGHSPRGSTRRQTDSVMIQVHSSKAILAEFEYAMTIKRREHNHYRPGLRPIEWQLTGYLTETGARVF